MKTAPLFSLAVLLLAGQSIAIEPGAADKSRYDLFHPVPDDQLRAMDTDRPDKSNSPHTLDAGHLQIETGLAAFTYDESSDTRARDWTWLDTNLRIGLTSWGELQLAAPLFASNSDTDLGSHETERVSGVGDLSVSLKTNFWGNDAGDTAGGMQFFVKTPTASDDIGNGEVEGGAIFLFGVQLPREFALGINSGAAVTADDDGGRHADIINSVSVSREIAGPLSGYLEFFSSVSTRHSGDWEGTVDTGLLLMIGENLQLDTGLNVGVTRGADDFEPFVGAAYRF